MTVVRLIKVHFCTLENSVDAALREETVGTFGDSDGLTAHGKIVQFLHQQPPEAIYLAWNGQFYPQFRMETHEII